MKPERKKLLSLGVAAFLLYLAIHYWPGVSRLLVLLLGALTPLLAGCAIAFIVNILMSFYEGKLFSRVKGKFARVKKPLSLVMAVLTGLIVAGGLCWLVIPQLVDAVQVIISGIQYAVNALLKNEYVAQYIPEDFRATLASVDWENRIGQIAQLLMNGIGDVMGFVTGALSSIFSTAASVLLGVVFALYLLSGKNRLKRQAERLAKAYLRPAWWDKTVHVLSVFNDSFHNYIVGQMAEALILGGLCAVGMLLFRFPYATMVGALVGVTALIPIAGAYIGAGVGAFMMLTVSPIKALLFLVYIVVLQQIEGNIIYPRVVGTSIGLPGIWVLAAVTVGGGLFGIPGMLIGVPTASALYRLLRENVKKREEAAKLSSPPAR